MVTRLNEAALLALGLSRTDAAALLAIERKTQQIQQSLTNPGYVRIGDFYIQSGTASTDATGTAIVTFPVTFKAAVLSVRCEQSGATAATGITFAHSTPTRTGFTAYASSAGTNRAAVAFDWHAIGF